MKFLDQAKIYLKSGDGGRGCVSFRREKYIEFGEKHIILILRFINIKSYLRNILFTTVLSSFDKKK